MQPSLVTMAYTGSCNLSYNKGGIDSQNYMQSNLGMMFRCGTLCPSKHAPVVIGAHNLLSDELGGAIFSLLHFGVAGLIAPLFLFPFVQGG